MSIRIFHHSLSDFYSDGEKQATLHLDPSKIYVLCQPYGAELDPKKGQKAFLRAAHIVRFLRNNHKVVVFSPILHFHNYHMAFYEYENYEENYYSWCMEIYKSFHASGQLAMVFTHDYKDSIGCLYELDWATSFNARVPLYVLHDDPVVEY